MRYERLGFSIRLPTYTILIVVIGVLGCSRTPANPESQEKTSHPSQPSHNKATTTTAENTHKPVFDAVKVSEHEVLLLGPSGLLGIANARTGVIGKRYDKTQPGIDFMSAALDSKGEIYVTDARGHILRTDMSLSKMHEEKSEADGALFDLGFLQSGAAIAVGEFGTVLHRANTGGVWERQPLDWKKLLPVLIEKQGDVAPNLYRLCTKKNDENAMVVGEFGVVLEWESGQWHAQTVGENAGNMFGCYLRSDGAQFVYGQLGQIFERKDKKQIWQKTVLPGNADIYDMTEVDGRLVAVGDGGIIFTSADEKTWHSQKIQVNGYQPSWLIRVIPLGKSLELFGDGVYHTHFDNSVVANAIAKDRDEK